MKSNRRGFIKAGVISAFFSLVITRYNFAHGQSTMLSDPSSDFPIPYEAQLNAVYSFRRETFEPYVGGIFGVRGTRRGRVNLTLLEVKDTSWRPDADMRGVSRPCDSFELLFQASAPLTELTSTHRLEHAALGSFNLFLTRTKGEGGQLLYVAVINHVI